MITPTIPVKLSCPKCGSIALNRDYDYSHGWYQWCDNYYSDIECDWESQYYGEQQPWYWWIDETDNVYNPQ